MFPCGGTVSLLGHFGAPALACGGIPRVEMWLIAGTDFGWTYFPLWEFAQFLEDYP